MALVLYGFLIIVYQLFPVIVSLADPYLATQT